MVTKKLDESRERWEKETLEPVLKKYPERQESFETPSGIPVERVYDPPVSERMDYADSLGYPGEYPYTRGTQPTMYRGRIWTMRQYAGFGSAEETNRRYRYLLDQGQTGLSVAFDLPTQLGIDSDHQLSLGEVGKVGVAISSLSDIERLFEGIPLDKVSTSMTINSPAAVLLAMYVALAEKQGIGLNELRGTLQNDILKEYISRNTFIFPPRPSIRLVVDAMEFCTRELPQFNSISVSGYHMEESGATAVQEVAFTFANAITYLRECEKRGLDVEKIAGRVSFFFASSSDFLEEVAKFRAARRLWARLVRDRVGCENPRAQQLRYHVQTAGCTLTRQQPEVNIVRTTLQALSAVLGGCQSLHTNSMDEALSLPSEKAVNIALRTQQVIAEESNVCSTVDPLAGSYYVEHLTDEIERRAEEYIERIEEMGGVLAAIEDGYMQAELSTSAYHHQLEVEKENRVVVGVNKYRVEEELGMELMKVDARVEKEQCNRLAELREKRDNAAVDVSLERLRTAAGGDENLMYPILDAVRSYATLGEICDVLRDEFGEFAQSTVV